MTKQKFNINFCKLCDTFLDVEPSLFTATLFVQLYWELLLPGALLLRKLLHYRHARAYKWKGSRHFRVPPGLCIKMRLSAQPLIWKWCFILMQIKLIFTRKVCTWPHFEIEGFWNWEGAYFFKVHTQKGFIFHSSILYSTAYFSDFEPGVEILTATVDWGNRSCYTVRRPLVF